MDGDDARTDGRSRGFPASAGILLGLGLGGFVDGIVFHQVLQWHHMFTSAGLPPDSLANLERNVLWDGVFHGSTWLFTVSGLAILWRSARRPHSRWPARMLVATMLVGFGVFNLFEGLVDHQILGIHHVNETVPREQWLWWDLGFLAWGLFMVLAGAWLWRTQRLRDPEARSATREATA